MSARTPNMTVRPLYDRNADEAAKFHAQTFPGSSVGGMAAVHADA